MPIFQKKQAVQEWEVISQSSLRQSFSLKVTIILMSISLGGILPRSALETGHALEDCWHSHYLGEFVPGRGREHQETQW